MFVMLFILYYIFEIFYLKMSTVQKEKEKKRNWFTKGHLYENLWLRFLEFRIWNYGGYSSAFFILRTNTMPLFSMHIFFIFSPLH